MQTVTVTTLEGG